jgi:hypothetical protein
MILYYNIYSNMSILLFEKNIFLRRHGWRRVFYTFQTFVSHNVPAVYDVLAARIRALRSKDQGGQNVAEKNPTKGEARLGFFVARAAYWRRSIYSPVMRSFGAFTISLFIFFNSAIFFLIPYISQSLSVIFKI